MRSANRFAIFRPLYSWRVSFLWFFTRAGVGLTNQVVRTARKREETERQGANPEAGDALISLGFLEHLRNQSNPYASEFLHENNCLWLRGCLVGWQLLAPHSVLRWEESEVALASMACFGRECVLAVLWISCPNGVVLGQLPRFLSVLMS